MGSGPFKLAAQAYYDGGWSPVPFPPSSKWPPVDDFTGAAGKYVDELQLKRWLKGSQVAAGKLLWRAVDGNIGLRLPPSVLGIDADMYEGKAGRKTLSRAVEEWGPLPHTWYSSSRTDGSGILLFQIPEGLAWPGKLPQGGGVELIRWDHRYAIVSPSIHDKTGDRYAWWRSDTGKVSDSFPDVGDLPPLPDSWVKGLTSGKKWSERAASEMDSDDVRLWLSDRRGPELCGAMRATLTRYQRLVRTAGDDGGSHDAGRDGAWALVGDAHAGHSGVELALNKLKKAFIEAVSRRSDERLAREEWARIVVRGVQKVAAEGAGEGEDLCGLVETGGPSHDRGGSSGNDGDSGGGGGSERGDSVGAGGGVRSGHLQFARSDTGNAERFVHAYRGEVKFVPGIGWYVWDFELKRWRLDEEGIVTRKAIAVVREITNEAEMLAEENPKAAADMASFARSSENSGRLKSMLEVAATLKGMSLGLASFDTHPDRLGPVLLKSNPGVVVSASIPEHHITMSLGAAYVPDARNKDWDRFLARCQPDPEVLDWLQRLVGYSLQGGNPDRLFIVCHGVTSTGKTTFMEAVRSALGGFAAAVNMTVYRDNQDDRPRPDLLRVLTRRVIMSEEVSSVWHLHADQIKRITGGAPITVRGMRSNVFAELVPAFTPWIFANSPPTIEGADEAVLRRLLVVPFTAFIPKDKEDTRLRDRLMSESGREAVLAWALDGWTRYAESPDLSAPLGALAARERYVSELSDFDRALYEIAVIEPDAFVTPTDLYRAYQLWCSAEGVKTESNTKLGTFLTGRGLTKIQKRVDGVPTWYRKGIRLQTKYASIIG